MTRFKTQLTDKKRKSVCGYTLHTGGVGSDDAPKVISLHQPMATANASE